jgi:hypothetical protein
MYPTSQGVTADKPNNPEEEKNNRDCPKHFGLLIDFRFAIKCSDINPACGKLPGKSSRLPVRIKYEKAKV